jgi:hypothetical protein
MAAGWFKESYRHYLAARGVPSGRMKNVQLKSYRAAKTKHSERQIRRFYATRDYLKGNRENATFVVDGKEVTLKQLYAKGIKKSDLGVPYAEKKSSFVVTEDALQRLRSEAAPMREEAPVRLEKIPDIPLVEGSSPPGVADVPTSSTTVPSQGAFPSPSPDDDNANKLFVDQQLQKTALTMDNMERAERDVLGPDIPGSREAQNLIGQKVVPMSPGVPSQPSALSDSRSQMAFTARRTAPKSFTGGWWK